METNGIELRINGVLGRLETILAKENDGIGTDVNFDIKASNTQKSRCLYELNLLFRDMDIKSVPDAFAARLQGIRKMLDINAIRVRAHLDAVRSVTDLLNDAVRASEADGTYSAEQFMGAVHP
jgi:hypothetical protein